MSNNWPKGAKTKPHGTPKQGTNKQGSIQRGQQADDDFSLWSRILSLLFSSTSSPSSGTFFHLVVLVTEQGPVQNLIFLAFSSPASLFFSPQHLCHHKVTENSEPASFWLTESASRGVSVYHNANDTFLQKWFGLDDKASSRVTGCAESVAAVSFI